MEERLALYRQELEEQSKAEVARQVSRIGSRPGLFLCRKGLFVSWEGDSRVTCR
jgi:hypothetical protein